MLFPTRIAIRRNLTRLKERREEGTLIPGTPTTQADHHDLHSQCIVRATAALAALVARVGGDKSGVSGVSGGREVGEAGEPMGHSPDVETLARRGVLEEEERKKYLSKLGRHFRLIIRSSDINGSGVELVCKEIRCLNGSLRQHLLLF